jgi:DMSO reductase anchor subunit
MFGEEWPLMMFTLLSQLAIGMFIMLLLVHHFLKTKIDSVASSQLTQKGMFWVGPIMALALVLSVFHLGDPLGAYRSVGNLATSWLSREILFSGLFFVLWFVTYFSSKKNAGGQSLKWLTALVGLLAVVSMASIYASSIRPTWSNVNTYLSFFGTMVVFGCAGTAVTIFAKLSKHEDSVKIVTTLQKLVIISVVAVAIQLVYFPIFVSGLGTGGSAAQASEQIITGTYLFPLILRWIISLLGIFTMYSMVRKQLKVSTILPANMVYLAFVLILFGEVIGRYLFYAAAVSIGIG